jgi:hypothetical protein
MGNEKEKELLDRGLNVFRKAAGIVRRNVTSTVQDVKDIYDGVTENLTDEEVVSALEDNIEKIEEEIGSSFEISNGRQLFHVRVGNDERPASTTDISKVRKDFKKVLKDKDAVFATHHAVSIDVFEVDEIEEVEEV